MPLITDYNEVKEVYQEAAEKGVALPVFCAEDRETLEAILASASEFGKKIGWTTCQSFRRGPRAIPHAGR